MGPYTCTFGLNHTPDGAIAKAARVAEEKKEASYFSREREFYDFLPLAFDVFGVLHLRRKISSSILQVWQ